MRLTTSQPSMLVRALVPCLAILLVGLSACTGIPGPVPTPLTASAPAATGGAVTSPPATAALPLAPASTPEASGRETSQTPAATSSAAARITPSPTPPPVDLAELRLSLLPVVDGLRSPLYVTHAGDGSGRLFVLEQQGVIRVLENGRLAGTPFLDIRDRVGSRASEQGLLGLAFAPDYALSGHFFVNYTDRRGDTTVARFSVSGDRDVADPGSEFAVLKIDQPAGNHNGGMLLFGPDGYLWIGTGDGGNANDRFGNGQNPGTLLGKMLRLDVTSDRSVPYLIPGDNPWLTTDWDGRDVRDEVWAVGLRNPWRYSFDRATGDLWIGDVGQNLFEEVHFVSAGSPGGLNFGWPIMEGAHCFPQQADCQRAGLEIPVADYQHGANGCSITGGYVYRGAQFPALRGVYLYSDYCSGRIWGLAPDGASWRGAELLASGFNISSFGEDEAGELYVTDLRSGTVYRLVVQ